MHILFLTDNFPPETNAPASRTYRHCRLWVRMGHRVTVLTGVPNFPQGIVFDGYRNRPFQRETLDGIEVVRVWTYIARNERFFKRTLDYMSFMASATLASAGVRGADLLVATSPQFFTAIAGFLVSRMKRVPFVFELRDLWPESIVAVGAITHLRLISLLERVEYFLYGKADRIVALTHAFKETLIRGGVASDKIEVIPNGVDLDFFRPQPKDPGLVVHHGLEDKFVAAYIGTHGMAHGLETVLEAAEKLRGHEQIAFLLIGEGAEKARLKESARARALSNVIFVDSQPKERIVKYWTLADAALVLLKKAELFKTVIPSKIFEAFAMERPVILGVEGEVQQILEKAGAGISIEPGNSSQLASSVLEILQDPARGREMGRRGRLFVEENYSRDRMAARYEALLRQLVDSKENGGRNALVHFNH